jgi:hypothetical protein
MGFEFGKHKNLEKFALYEMAKNRAVSGEPPHVRLMKKLDRLICLQSRKL